MPIIIVSICRVWLQGLESRDRITAWRQSMTQRLESINESENEVKNLAQGEGQQRSPFGINNPFTPSRRTVAFDRQMG